MPSPVAHSLVALAILETTRPPGERAVGWRWPLAVVAAAAAADVDFLTGDIWGGPYFSHHGVTHGFAAAAAAGIVSCAIARASRLERPIRIGLIVALAYASHVVLDFFAGDPGTPTDMPVFWPLATATWLAAPFQVFVPIEHDGTISGLPAVMVRPDTLAAMAREALLMGPVLGAVMWLRRRTKRRTS